MEYFSFVYKSDKRATELAALYPGLPRTNCLACKMIALDAFDFRKMAVQNPLGIRNQLRGPFAL
jgi:hypothetical protein